MRKIVVAVNVGATVLLAILFCAGLMLNDFEVQRILTELDRSGCFNTDAFQERYGSRYRGVRDQDFAAYLSTPWRMSSHVAVAIGLGLAVVNLLIALRGSRPSS